MTESLDPHEHGILVKPGEEQGMQNTSRLVRLADYLVENVVATWVLLAAAALVIGVAALAAKLVG
jgi:hypothetical protein